ncbi:glutathione S-transferase family protein [Roseateles terrae]|uniref:glutathione S-transferase family protein n=1 Tax=Roseateles terrae TaxID=431060 RepID=UPI0028739218|nr:glutathione S-transferase family protein [Roseateles terrae]
MQLLGFPLSGHSHRAQLALSLMGLPYEFTAVDLPRRAHKTPEFLALNPFGQVPVLVDDGVAVHDSNAILTYLALKYDTERRWLPQGVKEQAEVQAWLSVAAGLMAFGPAAARLVTVFGASFDTEEVIARAHGLLKVMDGQLAQRNFLVGSNATLADIAAYSYIAAAPEGNVDLAPYGHVLRWLARVEALPGFVPMPETAAGLRA